MNTNEIATKGRKKHTERARRKRRRRDAPVVPYRDRIARAFEREREYQRVCQPERECVAEHIFRCVCCGKLRGAQERREAASEVCVRCVEAAGYWN